MNLKDIVIFLVVLSLVLFGVSIGLWIIWHPDNNATYLGYIIILCTACIIIRNTIRNE